MGGGRKCIVLLALLILGYSCEKENKHAEVPAPSKTQDRRIEKAKTLYTESQSRTGFGRDTVDIFYAFQLEWGTATVETRDSSRYFVKVPISIPSPSPADSLAADMIFYEDSLGVSMEIWAYPSTNTYLNGIRDRVQNGYVAVINQRHNTSQVFYIQNGVSVGVDSFIVESSQFLSAVDRWDDPRCGNQNGGFWDSAYDWWQRVLRRLSNLAGSSGGTSGGSGNWGGWSNAVFQWSFLGGWVQQNTPNGGTGAGGGGINPNPTTDAGCNALGFSMFNIKYQTDVVNYFEDEAHNCADGCPVDFEKFEKCVIRAVTGINYANHWIDSQYFIDDYIILCNVIEQGNLPRQMAVNIFNACATFGASKAQMNTLIALASQNGAFDYLLFLEVNYGIKLAGTPPKNPPISVTRLVCPGVFKFVQTIDDFSGNRIRTAVLSNSYFLFTGQGAIQGFTLDVPYLVFKIISDNPNNTCIESSALLSADAINLAVSATQNLVNGWALSGLTQNQIEIDAMKQLRKSIAKELISVTLGCSSSTSGINYMVNNSAAIQHAIEGSTQATNCDALIIDCP